MNNIKITESKKVKGRLIITIDTKKKGELSSSGYSRKVASTDRFEPIEVGGIEFGLNLMLTKKIKKGDK